MGTAFGVHQMYTAGLILGLTRINNRSRYIFLKCFSKSSFKKLGHSNFSKDLIDSLLNFLSAN